MLESILKYKISGYQQVEYATTVAVSSTLMRNIRLNMRKEISDIACQTVVHL